MPQGMHPKGAIVFGNPNTVRNVSFFC